MVNDLSCVAYCVIFVGDFAGSVVHFNTEAHVVVSVGYGSLVSSSLCNKVVKLVVVIADGNAGGLYIRYGMPKLTDSTCFTKRSVEFNLYLNLRRFDLVRQRK